MWQHGQRGKWHQRDDDEDFTERGWGRGGGRGRVSAAKHYQFDEDFYSVLQPRFYARKAPALHPPTVLGSFSVDSEMNILHDNSMMPVLSQKYIPDSDFMKVDMDLNIGWHRVSNYTGTAADGFRHLLQWILKNQEKVRAPDSSDRLAADFVCSRRLLKKIMQAPYTHEKHYNAELEILAKYFQGTIYLTNEVPKEEKVKEKEAPSLIDIYGHKFEQYMTGGDPNDVLESNCQFRCVLLLHLNKMSLLFAPDTDAVDPARHKDDFKDMNSFVRLKARMESTKPYADKNYRKYVLNNWWIENKITGVPRLLVGTRGADGVVHKLQMLQTDDMPSLAQGEWDPSVCINILDEFLDFVKRRVQAEPDVVHRFERSSQRILHSSDPSREDILPNWYKQQIAPQDE